MRDGGCDEEVFSFAAAAVELLPPPVEAVPHSELGGLDLLEENRLPGLKMASSFSMAGEYPLPPPELLPPDEPVELVSVVFG